MMVQRKICVLAVAACAILVPALAATPADAYLNLQTCDNALFGYPSGTDDDFDYIGNVFFPGHYQYYAMGYYNRRSNNEIRRDIQYRLTNTGTIRQAQFNCNDSNGSGALSSQEDIFVSWTY